MKKALICLVAGALALTAQPQPQQHVEHDVVVTHGGTAIPPPGAIMHFESSIAGPVKGAPFSAESVTETVQSLSDGNRITRKQTGKSFRDGEGRTRTENQISAIGPWTPDEGLTIVSINDPVGRQHIMLNSKTKTATRIKLPDGPGTANMTFSHSESSTTGEKLEIRIAKKIEAAEAVQERAGAKETQKHAVVVAGAGSAAWTSAEGGVHLIGEGANYDVRKENLGKQMMEGVEVEGTRQTTTIPAGALGNERAIEVVTETWRSPALQMDVLRKHTDPRYGATTYRLTAIHRAEPARSLFEIPSDYKVEEPKSTGVRTLRRKVEGAKKEVREEIF